MITVYVLRTEALDLSSLKCLPFGESERERIEKIKNPTYKAESLGGLVALWRALDKRGASLPRTVLRSEGGKPYFDGGDDLPFNVSHSCGISAAALGDESSGQIGFDIEVIQEETDVSRIAERFFSDAEMREFNGADRSYDAFYKLWCAKEARAKLDGKGLSACLSGENADVPVTRLTLEIDNKRVVMAIAASGSDQQIQIFTDCEE